MKLKNIKFGCRKQPADSRDKIFKARASLAEFQDIDLRGECPAVRNQRELGACTAFGTTALFNFVRMKKGLPNWLPSPLFTYYATREKYGEQSQDNGAYVRDALKSTVKDGVAMERAWPYAVGKFDVKPSEDVYANAEKHQTLEYQSISSVDKNAFLGCLSEGYPFVFGIKVYSSFMSNVKGVIPVPDKIKDTLEGGHCMLCVGYQKREDGEYLIVQNSWTAVWGDKGYCYIPLSYFLADAYDLWTIRDTEASEDDVADPVEVEPLPEPEPVVEPVAPEPEPIPEPEPEPIVEPEPVPQPPAPSPINIVVEQKDEAGNKYRIIAIIIFILFLLLFTMLK